MLATQVNGHRQHSLLMFKPFNFELTGRQQGIAEYAARRWATAVKDQILVSLEQETDATVNEHSSGLDCRILEKCCLI